MTKAVTVPILKTPYTNASISAQTSVFVILTNKLSITTMGG